MPDEEKVQLCGICGKPCQTDYPDADVYHMSCMMEQMRPMREKCQQKGK